MARKDGAKNPPSQPRDHRKPLAEQIYDIKDATLRLWERNRHLQEQLGLLERRVRFLSWGLIALLIGSSGLLLFLLLGKFATLQRQVATLQETVTNTQITSTAPDQSATSPALEAARLEQLKQDVLTSLKQMVPELVAAAAAQENGQNTASGSEQQTGDRPQLITAISESTSTPLRVVVGKTDPLKTHWEQYNQSGIYVDVDTSEAGFSSPPYYFTSLGGHTNNVLAQGVTSIYTPTEKGFRVHVAYQGLTVEKAKDWGWYINWIAVGS